MKKQPDTSKLDFLIQYTELCHQNKICPLRVVSKYLKGTIVHLSPFRIRSEHWAVFLETICNDNSLTTISLYGESREKSRNSAGPHISSAVKTQKTMTDKSENGLKIGYCLNKCLEVSKTLQTLKLKYIPLSSSDLKLLSCGIRQSSSLQTLSLKGNLDDNGVLVICDGLKNLSTIEWVDFSDCTFFLHGLQAIITLLKHQSDKRLVDIWQQSLRYRIPNLDMMMGIRRITLNGIKIGDAGAKLLAETVVHDLWIKAIDLQNCDIHDTGAISFRRVLIANCVLEILDLRFNLISESIQDEIMRILQINNVGKTLKYEWFPPLEKQIAKSKGKGKT